eukprot:1801473-Lingulodinium_polyedra.AAC.1
MSKRVQHKFQTRSKHVQNMFNTYAKHVQNMSKPRPTRSPRNNPEDGPLRADGVAEALLDTQKRAER